MNTITTLATDYKIIDVITCNNIHFYHIIYNDIYYIYFVYNDIWYRCEATENIQIFYIHDIYVIFEEDNIIGFTYDNDSKSFMRYDIDKLIYVPIGKVIEADTKTDVESPNILTKSSITRYILSTEVFTDLNNLVDKAVDVIIDDVHYRLVWKDTYTKILPSKLGTISCDAQFVIVNHDGIFLAYNPIDYDKSQWECWYSIDGSLWKTIILPKELRIHSDPDDDTSDYCKVNFTLSETGSTLWCVVSGTIDDYVRIYYTILPYTLSNDLASWAYFAVNLTDKYSATTFAQNNTTHTIDGTSYSTLWHVVSTTEVDPIPCPKFIPMLHSAEDGTCAILLLNKLSNSFDTYYYPAVATGATFTLKITPDSDSYYEHIHTDVDPVQYENGGIGTGYKNSCALNHWGPTLITITQYAEAHATSYDAFFGDGYLSKDDIMLFFPNEHNNGVDYSSYCVFFDDNGIVSNYERNYWTWDVQAYMYGNMNKYFMLRYYPTGDTNTILLYEIGNSYACAWSAILNTETYEFDWRIGTDGWIMAKDIWHPMGPNYWWNESYTKKHCECIFDGTSDIACCSSLRQYSNPTFAFDAFYKFQDGIINSLLFGYTSRIINDKFQYGRDDAYLNTTYEMVTNTKSREFHTYRGYYSDTIYDADLHKLDCDIDWKDDIYNRNIGETYIDTIGYFTYWVYKTGDTVTKLRDQDDEESVYTSSWFKCGNTVDNIIVATEYYFYIDEMLHYFPLSEKDENDEELLNKLRPLGWVGNYVYYYYPNTNEVYTTYLTNDIYIDYLENASITNPYTAVYNFLTPSFVEYFDTFCIAIDNKLYQSANKDLDEGPIYIPENTEVVIPETITGLTVFSQQVLGVFTEHSAYEYCYSADEETGETYFYLYNTKIQLGNRPGYDIQLGSDGINVYMSTLLGMASLGYEDFVQSTEHVYTYLTQQIYSLYKDFDISPIKLLQFLQWIFMYRQDSNVIYIYDVNRTAWWKWTMPYNVTRMYYEGYILYMLMDNRIFSMDITDNSIYDIDGDTKTPISWMFMSQRMHFSAPTYYKHVNNMVITMNKLDSYLRYDVKFINYHNTYDSDSTDTLEYPIETIGTCTKKVNFMKTNALQVKIKSDDTDEHPKRFAVSSISFKYRITEKIR